MARCEPHPGQLYPDISLKGQGRKSELLEGLLKKYKKKPPPRITIVRAIIKIFLESTTGNSKYNYKNDIKDH
jgi:hypothetical protein